MFRIRGLLRCVTILFLRLAMPFAVWVRCCHLRWVMICSKVKFKLVRAEGVNRHEIRFNSIIFGVIVKSNFVLLILIKALYS